MTIADMGIKCKALPARIPRDVLIIGVLLTASSASFGLGFLAGQDVGQGSGTDPLTSPSGTLKTMPVVASKTGTKYYLPGCSGIDRITDDNKVWFASPQLAQAQGYEPAMQCDGL